MPSAKRRITNALKGEFDEFAEVWLQPGGVLYIAEMCVFFRQHFPHYLLNENLSDVMITDQLMKYNETSYKAETNYVGMLVGVQINRMQAYVAYKKAQQDEEERVAKRKEEHENAMKERDRELYGDNVESKFEGLQSEFEQSQDRISKIFDDDEFSFNSGSFPLVETPKPAKLPALGDKFPGLGEPQSHDPIDVSNRSPTDVMELNLDGPPVAKTTKATKKKKIVKKKLSAGTKTTTKKKKKTVGTAGAKDTTIPKKKKIVKKKKTKASAVQGSELAPNTPLKTKKKKKFTKKNKDSAGDATATTATTSTKKKTTKKKKGTTSSATGASATASTATKKKKKAGSTVGAKTKKKSGKGVAKKKITKKKAVQ